MQLFIDRFGAFIGKQENRFRISCKGEKEEYSADDVDQIVIQSPCSISSGAVKLAMEKNIDIVYLNYYGKPYGRIYPCKLGGTTLTRRMQLEAFSTEKGGNLAKSFVAGKIKNQGYFLKALLKERNKEETMSGFVKEYAKVINGMKGTCDSLRNTLLGIEGNCAARYFESLSEILPFGGRDQEGKDIVNIAFNYGYGILYSEIERACVIAGLDPYLGFMHTDRYGKPSMVLDLIEPFRPIIVDRAVVTLFSRKQLSNEDLEDYKSSTVLTIDGRKKISSAVLERLDTEIKISGRKYSFRGVLREEARNVVRYLLGQNEGYEPFIYRW